LLAYALIAVVGCSRHGASGDERAAIQKAKSIYLAIENNDFKRAASQFSPQFYQKISPEQWIEHLKSIHEKFGDLKHFDLKRVITSSNYNGVVLILKYKVFYSKHDAFEEMTFAPQPSVGHLEIMNYTVKLDKFDS